MTHESQRKGKFIQSEWKPEFTRLIDGIEKLAEQKMALQILTEQVFELKDHVKSLQEQIQRHESRLNSVLEYSAFVKESVGSIEKIPEIKQPDVHHQESKKDMDGFKSVIRLSIVELRDKNKLTFKEIADKLNAEGIQTFRTSGKKWYPQTVQKIYKQMTTEQSVKNI